MARKNTVNYAVLTGQSLAVAFQSPATVIKYLDNCSYQIRILTSSSVGSFTIQGSNDYTVLEPSNTISNPGRWVDLTLSGIPIANGANDDILIDLNQLPFSAIRVAYTPTTPGVGTCNITINCKQEGG